MNKLSVYNLYLGFIFCVCDNVDDFIRDLDIKYRDINNVYTTARFIMGTNLTDFNTKLFEEAFVNYTNAKKEIRETALAIDIKNASTDVKRQFKLLIASITSSNPEIVKNVSEIYTEMVNIYSKGTVFYDKAIIKTITPEAGVTELSLDRHLIEILEKSHDPKELQYIWESWRNNVGPPLRSLYTEYVRLKNVGARENKFRDAGSYKRDVYEVDNLQEIAEGFWLEFKSFYQEIHAYVRYRLSKFYPNFIKDGEPMPAHLLGNMWAQSWETMYFLTIPYPDEPSIDVTKILKEKNYDVKMMFKKAEEFFTSIGWPKLPESFWTKSLFVQPKDRAVTCHASAWDFNLMKNGSKDVRVKMCTQVTQQYFNTIHHELGHIYYYLHYWDLPAIYRKGANPGFHEAVGDTMILSIQTADHLKSVGLLDHSKNSEKADINFLLKTAMSTIVFLPFGYLMDQWMWKVYSGEITPDQYNTKWWEMRLKYQGIKPPTKRGEEFFDPGAKFHIPGDVPYIRYFFSTIFQFTFHKYACEKAGNTKALHKCSIYQSKKVGKVLGEMLKMGRSKPWPEVLETLTGSKKLSAEPINEYFAPLKAWLEVQRQKKKYTLGWNGEKASSTNVAKLSFAICFISTIISKVLF